MNGQNIGKEQILKNALVEIRRLKKEVQHKNAVNPFEPIAIIGMACRFPGGISSPGEYWDALLEQKDMISAVPGNRWRSYTKEKLQQNPFLHKAGFLLEDIEAFDHRLFRLSPNEVERIDPQQRLFLKVCWEAIENTGYAPDTLKGSKTGVYVGVSSFDHTLKLFLGNKTGSSPEPNDIMGSSFSFISGRVSYYFGFQGPGITLDTACSSSLVAVDQACKGLLMGDCDMAIAGGVNLMLSPETTALMASLNVLSPDCKIRTFDASANGTVRGEGSGAILLKRLSDAERDGDHIHAIIRGTGANQDGLSSGLTAPYGPAQEKLIRDVWQRSKTGSGEIDFIETHGTGTALGDPIEITALGNVIDKDRKTPVYVGAVKTAIGHLEAAAGIAGLMKAALAVEHGKIPGNLHFEKPTSHIDWSGIPIRIPRETISWEKENGPRKAAVSAFGLSGTNAHVVLEEYKPVKNSPPSDTITSAPTRKWFFRFSANDRTGLKNQLSCFREFVEQQIDFSIKDLSYSQNISRTMLKQKLVIGANDRNELITHLSLALEGKTNADIQPGTTDKKVVFLFSGGGSQYPGMFRELYAENRIFKKYLDQCNEAYLELTHNDLLSVIFADDNRVHEMCYTQVALFAIEYALAKTWMDYGVNPAYLVGHSTGEYAAACLSGVFNLEDAIKLITARGELMYALPKNGKMAAVRAKEEDILSRLERYPNVSIAATNTPEQTVISGAAHELEQLCEQLADEGVDVKPIKVTHASHSTLMRPMLVPFEAISKNIRFHPPSKKIISCVTGKAADNQMASYPYWSNHIVAPVRFMQAIRSIDRIADYVFLEVGPKGVLTQMVEIISDEPVDCLISNYEEENTSLQIEKCLFHLSNCGVDIKWKKFYQHTGCKKIFVPNYQFNEKHFALDAISMPEQEIPGTDFPVPVHSSYTFHTLAEVATYVRTSLSREWKLGENELTNDENLLLLGLNSITAAKLIKHWKDDLGVHLKPAPFFKNPTIDGWAEIIFEKVQSGEELATDNIEFVEDRRNRYAPFNFNDVQNAYFVGRNPEIEWGGYACYGYMEIDAHGLDVGKFCQALSGLIRRHEMLRCIVTPDGHQQILPSLDYAPIIYNYASIPGIKEHMNHTRNAMASKTIAPGNPMFDIRLTEKKPGEWCIHYGLDFIIADALSISIFWSDLFKLYNGEVLPGLQVSFRDYITYLAKRKEGLRFRADKQYWSGRIDTLPGPPKIPVNNTFGNSTFNGFRRREKWFGPQTWNKFVKSATTQNLTPSAALLAIFSEVLSAWGAGKHFGIILTVFERDNVHPQINDIIGDFTQLSLLEVKRGQQSIKANGQNLQWQMQEDIAHSSCSAIDVVREINKNRASGDVVYPFVFTSALGVSEDHVGFGHKNLFGETGYMVSQTPQVWLDSQVVTKNGGICISWDTLDQIFPAGMPDDMFHKYLELIELAITDDAFWDLQLSDLRPHSQKQAHTLVNQTDVLSDSEPLHAPVLNAAIKNKDKTAIVCNGTGYSYHQLVQRASQVSALLQANGLKKGDHVAVQMARSFDMVAVVLGIAQAGGVYIPVYVDNPADRTAEILQKSKAKLLFTGRMTDFSGKADVVQLTSENIGTCTGKWEETSVSLQDTAYVIYTSGSTGTPKGVEITHEAAVNTILDVNAKFNITGEDTVLGLSSLSFDLSVYDIFGVLGNGGTLVLPTEEERIDPKCWRRLSETSKITLWNSVPALLELYAGYILNTPGVEPDLNIRNIFLSGDWIPLGLHPKIRKAIPRARLISMGGATEASIWSNYYIVDHIREEWKSVPYGYPLANQSFYILDEFNRPCPDGVTGKLHIAGKGLAKGYLDEKTLTETAFFVHPELKIRLYDTGDYGRYMEDGAIEFLGRQDDQLKINGYRIETGEIREAFRKCSSQLDAIVLPVGEQMGSKKLVAFVKQNPGKFSETDLKQKLSGYLPPYFIPERIIALEEYPRTANGKIDQKRLIRDYARQRPVSEPATTRENTGTGENHPVLKTVRKVFGVPQLKINDHFSSLGISSMDIIRLANELEARFADRPAVGDMIRYHSAEDLVAYYDRKGVEFEPDSRVPGDIDPRFALYNKEQTDYLSRLELIENYEDRVAYKKNTTSQRKELDTLKSIWLDEGGTLGKNTPYPCRKSYREFLSDPVPLHAFKRYLSLCFQYTVGDKKQFNYGSAGGTYPVQMYLSVFKNKVEGVEEGAYYFDVRKHELIQLANEEMTSPDKLAFDHEWLHKSAFVIHFVADMEVIFPVYEQRALQFCYIESGLICQLLESQGALFNIGSCQLGGYDFEKNRRLFQLSAKHFYLHSLAAGSIDFQQEKTKIREAIHAENAAWKKEEEALCKLVKKCGQKGIALSVNDGALKFRAPGGVMTRDMQDELKRFKPLLVPFLLDQENKKRKQEADPAYKPFELTPIQWAFVTGRGKDFELGNTGAHYYSEIECNRESASKFESALNHVISHHEALRTIIYENGAQQVLPEIPYYKVQEHTIDNDIKIQEIREAWSHHKYEPGTWPMFHFEICHQKNNTSRIHMSVDLLVIDAWSGDLMLGEIFMKIMGHTITKPGITFKNYIRKEKEWYNNKQHFVQKAGEFWAAKLKNIPPAPELPYTKPFNRIVKPRYRRWKFELPVKTMELLSSRSRSYKLTATAVICTAFMKILSQWGNHKDLTLNITLFNRLPLHKDAMSILGDFTNVALVSYIANRPITFKAEAEEIQHQLWQVIEYRAKNGIELLRELGKNQPYKAIMPVVFTSLLSGESSVTDENLFPGDMKEVYAISQTPQVAIDHQVYRRGGNYILNWDVVEEAFDHNDVDNAFGKYETLVKKLITEENWDVIFEC